MTSPKPKPARWRRAERPPSGNSGVLVFLEDGSMGVGWYGAVSGWNSGLFTVPVTHWQPLPKPPRVRKSKP